MAGQVEISQSLLTFSFCFSAEDDLDCAGACLSFFLELLEFFGLGCFCFASSFAAGAEEASGLAAGAGAEDCLSFFLFCVFFQFF